MGSQKLLDHGYLTFIEHWGSDERIVEAARMSTGKGFLGWGPMKCDECAGYGEIGGLFTGQPGQEEDSLLHCSKCNGSGSIIGDEKLLAFLYNNKHATPFEMAGMVIEVQAPIFVFREWHRHRTQSYNEMSARYTPLPDLNYIPTVERLLMDGGVNKQAQSATMMQIDAVNAHKYRSLLQLHYAIDQELYQQSLSMGVPKELARIHLPVGRYSRMRASTNLRNWLAFLTLRQAPNAQWEIRQYANALNTMLVAKFPRTMELFNATANI